MAYGPAAIAANGLLVPIVTHKDQIVDGVRRHKACCELGLPLSTTAWSGKGSLLAFVISLNKERRHLSISQLAMVADDARLMFTTEAKERQREHAGTAPGKPKNTGGNKSTSDKAKARDAAGAAFGVSGKSVDRAHEIKEADPELADKVRSGEVNISKAARQVKRKANKAKAAATPPVTSVEPGQRFQCIVIDPPWDVSDEGDVNQMGRANPDYATMPINHIASLHILYASHHLAPCLRRPIL